MPKQQLLEKNSWDWSNHTDPHKVEHKHLELVYRVNLAPCKTQCRRNCKGNPHCLAGLGEKNWINEIADEDWHQIEDPNAERKDHASFVGLKNLGATCYVNSFLQLWYHNPEFRSAIYKWKPQDDPQENDSFGKSKPFSPVSCIGHLQLIFALLQFSNRRYIDPTPFITMLGLNTTQQQDAQEFCQLFISLLEEKISFQSDLIVRNIVQQQYSGELDYITRCHRCQNESPRSSQFYELDLSIKGHKDLFNCLQEFLQEEKLEGSNQYHCSKCQGKEDATRFIRLSTLPPVLHIQLLRFVFDRQTECKKKLNSFIKFPEVLDMSTYLRQPEGTIVYDVSAVLIHRGPSAYSGHYVAHIRDASSGSWFKFNDETVEKIEGKKLKLGTEESLTQDSFSVKPCSSGSGGTTSSSGSSGSTGVADGTAGVPKPPKLAKGWHSSNNAYMLAYTLRKSDEKKAIGASSSVTRGSVSAAKESPPALSSSSSCSKLSVEELPKHLQEAVAEDNRLFEVWIKDLDEMRDFNVMSGKARQNEIKNIYEKLPVRAGDHFEWITSSWLHKWLANETAAVPPIDNSHALCPHEKLSPDKVSKMKCINAETAEIIYEKYGGGPRLKLSFCRKCVEARCHIDRVKARLAEDHKKFTTYLRQKIEDLDVAYWIGKKSLRDWKKMALRQNEDLQDSGENVDSEEIVNNNVNGATSIRDNSLTTGAATESSNGNCEEEEDLEEEESKLLFNEDVQCEHNNLVVDENGRRLITKEAWLLLKQFFTDAPEFLRNCPPCQLCQVNVEETKHAKDVHRAMAQEQKLLLSDLYLDKNRPQNDHVETGGILYGVNGDFVDEWKRFIRDPTRKDPVKEVGNKSILCEHGLLPFNLNDPDNRLLGNDYSSASGPTCCWLKENEWEIVESLFEVDTVIVLTKDESSLKSLPEVCQGCWTARFEEHQQKQLDYDNAKIYVRRISKPDDVEDVAIIGNSASMKNHSGNGIILEETVDGVNTNNNDLEDKVSSNCSTLLTRTNSFSETPSLAEPPIKKMKGTLEKFSSSINSSGNSVPVAALGNVGSGSVALISNGTFYNNGDTNNGGQRRSSRRRKLRGEKEFSVSSTDSLRDLKVQIMKQFSVAPYDQHLTLDGRLLYDNTATLASLHVVPGCLILLKVDEIGEEAIVMEDFLKVSTPETGFKGTGLLRS